MGKLRKSREMVLQLLFQAERNPEQDQSVLLQQFWSDFPTDPEVSEWAEKAYAGVLKHKKEIDELIESVAKRWKISRMSLVDRNILRLGTYELRHMKDTPGPVVLNEAIEIAKRFGSEESGKFVNGILDKIYNMNNK